MKVQSEFYILKEALKIDGFAKKEDDPLHSEAIEFLSLFSDAFPNWQPEYEAINDLIPDF